LRAVAPRRAVAGIPSRAVPRLLAAALALAAVLLSAAAAAASWRAPVPGRVVHGFDYSPRTPFAAGARRGVDLAARPGERVLAPCAGRIAFAGRVPRFGPALSIRCGALVATLLRVRATRHGPVARGALVGRAIGPVRLGARLAAQRFGYVDPLALIGAEPPRGAAPLPAPPVSAPRRQRPRVRDAPPLRLPWTAWAGLGLLGSLLGPWAVSTSRRRSTTSTQRRTSVTPTP
jgi:hypothetical protein